MSPFKNQLRVKGQPKQEVPGKFNNAMEQQQAPQQAQMATGNKGLTEDFGNQSQTKKPLRQKKVA